MVTMIAALLTACEGTWATPNQVTLHPFGGSHTVGIAGIAFDKLRFDNHMPPGTNIDVQFTDLHDAKRYVMTLQRGSCAGLPKARPVTHFGLYSNEDPHEGIQGDTHVD